MAIGSTAEIGTTFDTGADTFAAWQAGGSNVWRAAVGGDLLGGFATLAQPPTRQGTVP